MEAATTFRVPPELTLDEDQKGQLSGLVQTKLEETKTLTLVSTDETVRDSRGAAENNRLHPRADQGNAEAVHRVLAQGPQGPYRIAGHLGWTARSA
jgi:hypothetical protein